MTLKRIMTAFAELIVAPIVQTYSQKFPVIGSFQVRFIKADHMIYVKEIRNHARRLDKELLEANNMSIEIEPI